MRTAAMDDYFFQRNKIALRCAVVIRLFIMYTFYCVTFLQVIASRFYTL